MPCGECFAELPQGCRVEFAFHPAPALRERLAAERAGDAGASGAPLVIAPSNLCAELEQSGQLVSGSRVPVGSIGASMLAHQSAAPPLINDVPAMGAALLAAPAVVFNRASSGSYIERMLSELDLLARLSDRIVRTDSGAEVVERIANELPVGAIGFGQSTEIRRLESKGVRLLGPLPSPVASNTLYEAGELTSGRSQTGSAVAFLRFLETEQAMAILRGAGIDQPGCLKDSVD